MRVQYIRVLLVLTCLAFGFGVLGGTPTAAAASKKKGWPSKKHHKSHHKSGAPAAKSAAPKGGAAPAEEADDDESESAEDDEKQDDAKAKPKGKTAGAKPSDDDQREASESSGDKSHGDDEGDDSSVVHRKAKRPQMEGESGAPIAFELAAGPRAIHRNFDFHDPLSDHQTATKPYAYVLPAAPAPFVDLALYPAAFATRGFAANLGLIARYEKILGTKTQAPDGSTFSTLGQQYEVGVRGRLPVGEHDFGLTASYGKHTFHVSETDPGPATGSVPNVDYTFAGLDADARLRFSPIELGAHVGSRLVFDTGSLGKAWFSTVKTNSIEAGLSASYHLTPLFSVVGGVDFLRYGFNFNPVPVNNAIVAGGAVDQYISGFLALRVTLSGN